MTIVGRVGNSFLLDDNSLEVVTDEGVKVKVAGGGALPDGGTTGQVLTKESDADGDAGWETSGGGGLPTGWTIDDPSDGDLNSNGGVLFLGDGGINAGSNAGVQGSFSKNAIEVADNAGPSFILVELDLGVLSTPTGDVAFTTGGAAGATVALDAGGLPVINLPTSDPGIAGALWNNEGTPAISTG